MAADDTALPERKLSPDEIERHWFENVYQGDKMKQATVRAVVMGMMLGALMCLSNVYVGLKAGWSMGVAITSCILAYVIFQGLTKIFRLEKFSILENNAMQSAASAAGSMTSAGIVNAIPALMMLNPGAVPPQHILIVWVILISSLGVFLAIPAKRQYINIEQLPYPSGTAAASTLKALHSEGGEAAQQAKALGIAAALGAAITWFRDANIPNGMRAFIPTTWGTGWIKGPWLGYKTVTDAATGIATQVPWTLQNYTLAFEGSLLFVAGGALISFRQAWSMLLGAVVNYAILAPIFVRAGDIETVSFRKISSWSLWIGVPMMVTSGLLLFIMNWKTVVRAFGTLTKFMDKKTEGQAVDPLEAIEVPSTWFLGGVAVLGTAIVILGHYAFNIAWWMGVIAVLSTFLLVVVAARATGETDVTPVGPLSKITQLTFGAIKPGDVTVNLMTANITAGATSHAGDLLTDLKSGYLLGANPRQQFFAQFFGVLAGGFIVVPAFFFLIPDASLLGGEKWPAPAALVWRGVAELLAKGPSALPHSAQIGLAIGAVLGVVLVMLEKWFPKHLKYIPSPTGLGMAMTFNGYYSVSFFLGACIREILQRVAPKVNAQYTVPVSSGIIAGESLMGVLIAVLSVLKILE
ncbi:MAG: OPT family oligopeptide transporter [Candidatus Eisenbacteria bacterium]